ncbi:OLC1v1017434C1 [Oldenlandia corymbosa var. corymbosa]|uniref:OLC1v1017434C1 n=1 Tax=Oldenlandia corymbosa var. corymbosa TaxID=529605 RepID=A0AAV1E9M3_OLDCO|nr:OLC1v1017434C1 [Oldenlandia corymbosa var. corymbosa]
MAVEGRASLEYDQPGKNLLPVASQTCPWLLISHDNSYYTRSIPWLHNKIPLCESYGWMVCQDIETGVCNPISEQDMQLPPLQLVDNISKVIVSRAPDCLIFIIGESKEELGYLAFCKLGDKKFQESKVLQGRSILSEVVAVTSRLMQSGTLSQNKSSPS